MLITGDMTDAGRSAEWAEFRRTGAPSGPPRASSSCPAITTSTSSTAPIRRGWSCRSARARGCVRCARSPPWQPFRARASTSSTRAGGLGETLLEGLEPHRRAIAASPRRGPAPVLRAGGDLGEESFPDGAAATRRTASASCCSTRMRKRIFPSPMRSASSRRNTRGSFATLGQYPKARWIVALHHHPVEYPPPAKAFSERIGTALINGSRFVRLAQAHGALGSWAMHGHRHIDWIGRLRRAPDRLSAVAGHGCA